MDERNRRKFQIDQFLQFLLFQARMNIIRIPEVLELVAENFARKKKDLYPIVFSNSQIRHTFSEEQLFETWRKILFSVNEPPIIKPEYNNDASQFSANLFAAGIGRKIEKKQKSREKVPGEIQSGLSLMNFPIVYSRGEGTV